MATGFTDVYLRSRRDLRDHESLCDQDGGGTHDLCVQARDSHRFHAALDCIPRIYLCVATPPKRTLYRLDYTGLPAVGAPSQHLYPN